ncbi:MAG TPA: ABC transporter permease [Cyclobacteriaceae bacterium]|nr:ABC transporter permease [Cyclobacteriaceae bacterium]
MLENYLKLTWRNLVRNSTYSIIIITGLVLAYSACLVIFLFVQSETSYDRQSPDAERIYRVIHDATDDKGTVVSDATTSAALAPVLADNISQIESFVRITPTWGVKGLVRYKSKAFYEQRIFGVDSNFASFFGLKVIAGEPTLRDKRTVAITESIAEKYFGDEDPIDKTLEIQVGQLYRVGAVIEDAPYNMHFHYDILSWIWTEQDYEDYWSAYNFFTYIKLKDGANIADVEPQIQQLYEKYRPKRLDHFYTQPLTDIHLKSKTKWELEANGNQTFVTIFITIGIFILLIASVNYINLSIVQALNRSKEVGVRKVSGAQSRELVDQFLLESTLISIVAFIAAVLVVQGVRPVINIVFDQHLSSLFSLPFYYMPIIFVCAIGAGVLSGLYPAMYLSAFQPAVVLKGIFMPGGGNVWLRKSLVVLQFAISIALISGAVLVFMQVNYLRSKELGFDKDQVIMVPNISDYKDKAKLKEAFKNVRGVESVGASNGILGVGVNSTTSLADKKIGIRNKVDFSWVDEDYLDAIGVELIAGRKFSNADVKDGARKVVLNQKAVMDLGLNDEEAIGALVTQNPYADSVTYYEVIGVVKDFHITSLRTQITPYAFFLFGFQYHSYLTIKANSNDYETLLADLGKAWTAAGPPGPFEYFFLDERYDSLYRTEENFQLIFAILTAISIYIACSGLFAVASYFIKRRTKEIGIRKALGASVSQVTWLVSSGFIRMVIIANLIAWPVTYMFMDEWLNGFAYRISINWLIFAISGVLALLIAIFTIGGQSVKAAQANPIQSLRNE